MKSVNFIPAHRLHERQRRRRLGRWGAAWAAYVVVLLGAYVCCCALYGGGSAHADELASTGARIQQSVRSIDEAHRELSAAKATLKANQAVGNPPDWSLLLGLLARSLSDEVVLRRCVLAPGWRAPASSTPPPGSGRPADHPGLFLLAVTGYGRTQAAVSEFVLHLEQAGLFDQVKLVKTSREMFLSSNAIAFRLECSLAGKAGESP